ALFGETTGETDELGLPVRYDWASEYRGPSMVVYVHAPVELPEWVNRTINIDTGCVFGGRLTALRYPERELVSVPAARIYYAPARPLVTEPQPQAAPRPHDELLDIGDVTGKRVVTTRLHHTVTIREEHAAAALEVMSRFAIDPRWLVYLPPTMSPSETSREPGLLEHPREAFDYYRSNGVARAVLQEKHMGSRAVLVVCRDEAVARRRFGVADEGIGACYPRTGRRHRERSLMAERYTAAYRRYCWPVTAATDLRLAPFHLLASETAVHADQPHSWHMETLARLVTPNEPMVVATCCTTIDLTDAEDQA